VKPHHISTEYATESGTRRAFSFFTWALLGDELLNRGLRASLNAAGIFF